MLEKLLLIALKNTQHLHLLFFLSELYSILLQKDVKMDHVLYYGVLKVMQGIVMASYYAAMIIT